MPQISLLLSVLNGRPFLDECLQSVLQQTLADWQVVAVDDGSTDGSGDLLARYARSDSRFVVLRNAQNRGLSYSRNRALRRAEGRYVMMLDADDRLSPDALEAACAAFAADPMADVALLHLVYWPYPHGALHEFPLPADFPLSGREAFSMSLDWHLHGVYAARREFSLRYPYDEAAKLYSDDNTPRIHFLHARHVALSAGTYFYRRHAASLTHRLSVRRFDYLTANLSLRRTLLAEGADEAALRTLEQHRWLNWLAHARLYLIHKGEFSASERTEIERILATTLRSMDFARVPARAKWRIGNLPGRNVVMQRVQQRLYLVLHALWQRLRGRRKE